MSSIKKFVKSIFKGSDKPASAGPKNKNKTGETSKIKKEYLDEVVENTGWTKEHAAAAMRSAKKNIGATYYNYVRFKLYEMTEEEAGEFLRKRELEKEDRAARQKAQSIANREHYLDLLAEKTGWDRPTARANYREARARTGCTAEEYFLYRFDELTPEEQEQVFLIRDSKKITKKYNVDRKFVNILYHKEICNEFFQDYIKRAWCVNTRVTEEDFIKRFQNSHRVFYKPTIGHHGDDARSYDVTPENISELYHTLAEKEQGVVEEYIVQHHKMQELAPAAVNTLRLATISSNDLLPELDGEHIKILYASQKMGGVDSVVDNLVGGGLVASVDLETGKISTDAVDDKGNTFATHPGTGTTIKGFQIPYFNECLELVRKIYEEKKIEGYLGWDIAITEDGPELVEVNAGPGVILFQLPEITEKHFMKQYMQPYMGE
ncbi:MAG: sugar-transfer associated ATP-grasp domain-containing protein [Anaerovoracaceae bacterium]|jgi:hypothetical protein